MTIEITAYDPLWPAEFEREAAALLDVLGALALSIDHVGSTSVPGLAAKPVIDIQISVMELKPLARYCDRLAAVGYSHASLGDFDLVYPYFEKPSIWPHTHHVHLCRSGSEEERVHLAFRDYLRDHPTVTERYVILKRGLAHMHHGDTLQSREAYSLSKTAFVTEVLASARAQGYL